MRRTSPNSRRLWRSYSSATASTSPRTIRLTSATAARASSEPGITGLADSARDCSALASEPAADLDARGCSVDAHELSAVGKLPEPHDLAAANLEGHHPVGVVGLAGGVGLPTIVPLDRHLVALRDELARLESVERRRLGDLLEEFRDRGAAMPRSGLRQHTLGADHAVPVDRVVEHVENRVDVAALKCGVGVFHELGVLSFGHRAPPKTSTCRVAKWISAAAH